MQQDVETTTYPSNRFARRVPGPMTEERPSLSSLFPSDEPVIHVQAGGIISLHGQPADRLFLVVSGTVRCCTITQDGRRQIFRFVRGGECLGFTDLDTWHFTAEAVDHVIVRSVSRQTVEAALKRDGRLLQALRAHVLEELATRERQLTALAFRSAEDRLAEFLRSFASPRRPSGYTVLPMTRQDIGDHLGMTLESVSRNLGTLKRKGIIEMSGTEKYRMVEDQMLFAA